MPKPYRHLRAQMAPAARRQAADKARALLAADAWPLVRWPLPCPFCQGTAPLTAYDLREGGIYTCNACQVVLRQAMWTTPSGGCGHLRWTIPEHGA